MYRNLSFSILAFILCFTACNSSFDSNKVATKLSKQSFPPALKKSLEKHGGLSQWDKMNTLTYALEKDAGKEVHQIDLKSRKVNIKHPEWTIGYDGSEVWVAPNKEAFGKGSPRFYHNLYFYFFALPYVMADPGINYEALPQRELEGKNYDVVKITFNENVGDAPDDYYIGHFDTETGLLHLLLYTVTYYNQTTNEKYNALVYEDWKKYNGLYLPQTLKGYKYAADTLGEQRYTRSFININIDEKPLASSLFEKPDGAEVDEMIVVE